jgi:hypothetical protein
MPTLNEVVLKHGFFWGYVTVVMLGAILGMIGYYAARMNSRKIGVAIFPFFIFSFVLQMLCSYLFTDQFNSWYSVNTTQHLLLQGALILITSVMTFYCISERRMCFTHRNLAGKMIVFFFTVCAMTLVFGLARNGLETYFLSKTDKASFISDAIIIGNAKDIEDNLKRLKKIDPQVSPYVSAIANIRLGKNAEAGRYFAEYASQLKDEPTFQQVIQGFGNYYVGNNRDAFRHFMNAKEEELAIASLYMSGEMKHDNLKSITADSDLIRRIRSNLSASGEQTAQNNNSNVSADSSGSDKWVQLKNFYKLEREGAGSKISSGKKHTSTKKTEIKQELKNGPESLANVELKIDIKASIENTVRIKAMSYKNLIINPVKTSSKKAFTFLISVWMLFLGSTFGTATLIREWGDKTVPAFKPRQLWIPLQIILKKCTWHSPMARHLCAKIALMEQEKGIFSHEIGNVKRSGFPFDVCLACFYHAKAKKISRDWRIESQEKKDIEMIYQSIKKISGLLIPQGDEQTLAILSAIRKNAVSIVHSYLKKNEKYEKTRARLLEVLQEIDTVGDILEAKTNNGQISYYTLLGISKDADSETIKKSYRRVIIAIHPDKNPNNPNLASLAALVNSAYSTLSNDMSRKIYNQQMGY